MMLLSQVTPIIGGMDGIGNIVEFKNRQYLFVYGAYPEIRVTDGTSNPVKSVKLFPNGTTVFSVNKTNDKLFIVTSSTSGTTNTLSVTDGTNETLTDILTLNQQYISLSPTTQIMSTINDKRTPRNIIGSKLIFSTRTSSSPTVYSLWVSDGTAAGTFKLTSSSGDNLDLLSDSYGENVGGNVYFNAKILNSTDNYYLWKTDGTIAGTTPVLTAAGEKLYTPTKSTLESINGKLIFVAKLNSNTAPARLWITDGTALGTEKIFEGLPYYQDYNNINTYLPKFIGYVFKNKFYFYGNDGTLGDYYVYASDGTLSGTKLLKNTGDANSNIKKTFVDPLFISDGNYLYFAGQARKWLTPTFSFNWDFYLATDGTNTKTIDESGNFPTIYSFFVTNDGIIANQGNNSFRFNGWEKPVKTVFTSTQLNLQGGAYIYKNKIFFAAAEGISNNELWVSDGTQMGTKKFAEIAAGTLNSDVRNFFEINNTLYFFARQGNVAGYYIYKLGEDYTFNGAVSNSLTNPQNWNSGSLPTSVDNATIPAGFNVSVDNNFVSKGLDVSSPINLTSGNLNVSGNLNLNSKITLNANNLVLKGLSSSVTGNTSSYIVTNGTGSVSVENLDSSRGSVELPIGTTNNYNPVTLSNSGTTDTFSGRVSEGVANTTIENINTTWEISETTAGGSNVNLTLGWNESQETAGFVRNNASIMHYIGGSWTAENSGSVSGSNPYQVTASGITSFSPFTILESSVSTNINSSSSNNIKIYPNPCADILNVNTDENSHIKLFNSVGKCVFSAFLIKGYNSMSIKELMSDTYFFQIKNKNEIVISSGKLIKK